MTSSSQSPLRPQPPSTQKLIDRIRGGNIDAFATIVETHQTAVRSFIAMLGVLPADVDEVAQQTFVAAYKHLDRYDCERPILHWLRGIARNYTMRHFHELRKHRTLQSDEVLHQLAQKAEPQADTEFAHHLPALRACIEKLPLKSRKLLTERYWQNLNSTAQAQNSNATAIAIRVAMSRIRLRLKECIKHAEAAS